MTRRILGVLGAIVFLPLTWSSPAVAQVGSPGGPVPPERLVERRAALLERMGTGVAVLRSADERNYARDYPQDSDFRQDNNFFYLTGLETPRSWLVLVAREGGEDEVILFLPPRDTAAERWTGPQLGPGPEASRITGIRDVRSSANAEAEIERLLQAETASSRLLDVKPHLAAMRLVKDDDELRRLRRAIEITTEAQREAMRALEPGMWEYELEALVEYTFHRLGAERVGFPSIIGSGPNSTILHYDKSRRQMQAGDLVVVDIGAEFGYYTADVTRTLPVSGRFTPRQRALYDLVLGAQQAAIDQVRPGVTIAELTATAREYMRANSGDLCGEVTCDRYFIHGLSHWLGMDVHDVGDYGTPFVPGMVLTIEPGIYIPEEEIGIRIEDDVLVTADGYELLSVGAPRSAEEVERLMGETSRLTGR